MTEFIFFFGELYPFNVFIFIIILNDTLNKKQNLLSGGVNVIMSHSFTRFIQTADSFRNEVNGSLYEWAFESLVHTIHSKCRFIQKLDIAVLTKKHIILCLKYNTLSTSYLPHLHSRVL